MRTRSRWRWSSSIETRGSGRLGRSAISATACVDPTTSSSGRSTREGQLLGYACYGPTPQTDRAWDLYWIAVAKEAHGQGVGSKLLAEVERRLAAERARILLDRDQSRATDYAATRTFYASRGYTEEARIADFYAPADDRVMFAKHLSVQL